MKPPHANGTPRHSEGERRRVEARKILCITGAILCGGESKRFGSDKRLYPYQGQTLLEHTFYKLEKICSQVVCVFRDKEPDYFSHLQHIYDDLSIEGPMAGLLSALQYCKTSHVLCVPCDMPKLQEDFLEELCSYADEELVVVPAVEILEPLVGLYPKSFYEKLKYFSLKSNSLYEFIENLPGENKKIIYPSSKEEFLNMNSK